MSQGKVISNFKLQHWFGGKSGHYVDTKYLLEMFLETVDDAPVGNFMILVLPNDGFQNQLSAE